MPIHISRFSETARSYAQFRPAYPLQVVTSLALRITRVADQSSATVLDVGSGTGIFTRQLKAALPAHWRVVGVEPAAAMREQANLPDVESEIAFVEGTAERLPAGTGSAEAVVAATAAHWFDRRVFYGEARRVLVPGGVLAILEYVRAPANSPAVAAVEEFLSLHGEVRAYSRPDYESELASLDGFRTLEVAVVPTVFKLSVDQFVGLALSSSHARVAVATLGLQQADGILRNIGTTLADADNNVSYAYDFQSCSVQKR